VKAVSGVGKTMTPAKPKYLYDCPLLLSRDDVKAFREANVGLAEIATLLREVKEMTADNHRTIRGHNGTDGLISRLTRLEERLNDVTATVESLKDLPATIKDVTDKVDALKDVPAAVAEWRRYPSLTWMVRNKPKEMTLITVSIIALSVFIGFPGTAAAQSLQAAIELLFAKWLKL
jgi:hypothetical protein